MNILSGDKSRLLNFDVLSKIFVFSKNSMILSVVYFICNEFLMISFLRVLKKGHLQRMCSVVSSSAIESLESSQPDPPSTVDPCSQAERQGSMEG